MGKLTERIWVWWDDEYDVGVINTHGDKRYTPSNAQEYVRALPAARCRMSATVLELRDDIAVVLGRNGKTKGKVLIHNLKAGREWDAVALEISDIPSVIAALTKLKGGATSDQIY